MTAKPNVQSAWRFMLLLLDGGKILANISDMLQTGSDSTTNFVVIGRKLRQARGLRRRIVVLANHLMPQAQWHCRQPHLFGLTQNLRGTLL